LIEGLSTAESIFHFSEQPSDTVEVATLKALDKKFSEKKEKTSNIRLRNQSNK